MCAPTRQTDACDVIRVLQKVLILSAVAHLPLATNGLLVLDQSQAATNSTNYAIVRAYSAGGWR